MKKYLLTAFVGLYTLQFVHAHSPFLSCKQMKEEIECEGSFSDGSSVFGVRILVLDYSDETLFEGKLDKENKILFKKPDEEEYYVKFDADESHVFEVDYTDIEEEKNESAEKPAN